ncbi:hypothetical protein RRG08_041186 [Elysia crispata]|uniref:Uncharacterized protein n=1 Tax=Elysia crispata TaxID=231223 RepID=A0AAE0XXQ6_9GAST|nr:hypothetical protein RRG08_041186 [Elysia crispata]
MFTIEPLSNTTGQEILVPTVEQLFTRCVASTFKGEFTNTSTTLHDVSTRSAITSHVTVIDNVIHNYRSDLQAREVSVAGSPRWRYISEATTGPGLASVRDDHSSGHSLVTLLSLASWNSKEVQICPSRNPIITVLFPLNPDSPGYGSPSVSLGD